jgi:hypothetical protein
MRKQEVMNGPLRASCNEFQGTPLETSRHMHLSVFIANNEKNSGRSDDNF